MTIQNVLNQVQPVVWENQVMVPNGENPFTEQLLTLVFGKWGKVAINDNQLDPNNRYCFGVDKLTLLVAVGLTEARVPLAAKQARAKNGYTPAPTPQPKATPAPKKTAPKAAPAPKAEVSAMEQIANSLAAITQRLDNAGL